MVHNFFFNQDGQIIYKIAILSGGGKQNRCYGNDLYNLFFLRKLLQQIDAFVRDFAVHVKFYKSIFLNYIFNKSLRRQQFYVNYF